MKKHLQKVTALALCACIGLGLFTPARAAAAAAADTPSELHSRIDAYVDEHSDTTAAMSVAVFKGGEQLYLGRYGSADKENGIKNDENTVFEWGSCTKLLVWVSVMQLYEKGLIELDADIRGYLPEGFLTKLKYDEPVTMLNLMDHNAGFQENLVELFVPEGRRLYSLEESLRRAQCAQVERPGAVVGYSNYGAALAGYIVERVSGIPFYEYVHKNIFAPLSMEHTALNADLSDHSWVKEQRKKLACYSMDGTLLPYPYFQIPLYPAGMATGTIDDFCRFGQALTASAGDERALFEKEETRALFYSPTQYFPDGESAENCHGMWVSRYGTHLLLGHGGNTAGCSAQLSFDPQSGEGMVVMTNQSGEGVYCQGLYTLLYGEVNPLYEKAVTEKAEAVGFYQSARTVKRGMLRIYGLMSLLPVMENTDGSLYVPVVNYRLEQLAPQVYSLDANGQKLLAYTGLENGRVERVSMMAQDCVRLSDAKAMFMALTVFLFFVAFLYALVMLVIALIRRLKKKAQPLCVVRALTNASIALGFINLLSLLGTVLSYIVSKTQLTLQALLFALFALVPFVFLYRLLKARKELSKKQKWGLGVNAAMGLILSLNVLYWQLFAFWI